MQPVKEIKGFQGEYRWLSNFEPCRIIFADLVMPSVEHAYVAAKIADERKRAHISIAATPAMAKRLGQKMKTRDDWDEVKDGYMMEFLIQKFSIPKYARKLLATGDAYIEETNAWGDTYWGVCNGKGLNKLGIMIMEIREILFEMQEEA